MKILALSLLTILAFSAFTITLSPQSASAQTALRVTGFYPGHDLIDVDYTPQTGDTPAKIWALAMNGTGVTRNFWMYKINFMDYSIEAMYNVTQRTSTSTYRPNGLQCSYDYCYIGTYLNSFDQSTSGFIDKMLALNSQSSFVEGDIMASVSVGQLRKFDLRSIAGSIDYITTISQDTTLPDQMRVRVLEGAASLTTFSTVKLFNLFTATNPDDSTIEFVNPADDLSHAWIVTTQMAAGATSAVMDTWNFFGSQLTKQCGNQPIGTLQAGEISSIGTNAKETLNQLDDNANVVLFGRLADGSIEIHKIDDCTFIEDVPASTWGFTTSDVIRDGIIIYDKNLIVLHERGAGGRVAFATFNGTTITPFPDGTAIIALNSATSQVDFTNEIKYIPEKDVLIMAETNGAGSFVVIDISDITAITPPEAPPATGLPNPIGNTFNEFGCFLGLFPTKCTFDANGNPIPANTDIKTNGMGLIANFLLMGIMIALVIGASHGKKLFQSANLALYAIVIIGSLGIGFLLQWHDGILFYVSIFAVVSLGGIKIAQMTGIIQKVSGGDSE